MDQIPLPICWVPVRSAAGSASAMGAREFSHTTNFALPAIGADIGSSVRPANQGMVSEPFDFF